MGSRDISEKILEDCNDVFADIVNNLLFDGEQIVQPKDLENVKDKSQYKAEDGVLHEQERDTTKFWKNSRVRIAVIGLENQTDIDADMPLRVIGYDGAAYRSQLINKRKERYPVITVVLYFGKKNWNENLNLSDRIYIPEKLAPYFNDYHINVFEIANLSEEKIKGFQSDFYVVADYFRQKRLNCDYVPSAYTIKHVDEVLKMMKALTGNKSFEEILNNPEIKEGGISNMCEVMDRIEVRAEARGIEQGLKQGIEQGIEQGLEQGIEQGLEKGILQGKVSALYYDAGWNIQQIAVQLNLSAEQVKEILE